MNDMSPTTGGIVQTLTIAGALLVHCSAGDNSVNMRPLNEQPIPLVLNDHQSVHPTSDNVTNESNTSFGEREVSMVSYVEDDTSFTSQYSVCDPKKEAMLISVCPATAEEEDRAMCQSDEAPPTVDTIFPVTDSVSGYHFRNFHCWKCSNQSGEPLTWSGELSHNFETGPENYSSLSSFLRYVDENPAFITWKPPGQFSYPECENVGSSRCTVCVPKGRQIYGCSLLGSPQRRVGQSTYTCYACTSYQASHSLNDVHLCENIHPEEVTFICNWLSFSFSSWNRSSGLIIEHIPGKACDNKPWASLKCSVYLGTCSPSACKDNILFLDGKCDHSVRWFIWRYNLCQVKAAGEGCSLQTPRDFLDQQFRNVEDQPVNITALDEFEKESDFCPYEIHKGHELNYSDSATLKEILTTPINQLVLIHKQMDEFTYLQVNISEKNDFDTIEIEVSGWQKRLSYVHLILRRRLRSIIIQTMMTVGVKGNHSLCDRYMFDVLPEGNLQCQLVRICPTESQEDQSLTSSDAERIKAVVIVSGLGIALIGILQR